ncbi:MAG TPA: hypothetical protein VK196_10840, partial [Magnetospirillum sp.]|nr:hypothetical protein [Magnetospirillum sp.]
SDTVRSQARHGEGGLISSTHSNEKGRNKLTPRQPRVAYCRRWSRHTSGVKKRDLRKLAHGDFGKCMEAVVLMFEEENTIQRPKRWR